MRAVEAVCARLNPIRQTVVVTSAAADLAWAGGVDRHRLARGWTQGRTEAFLPTTSALVGRMLIYCAIGLAAGVVAARTLRRKAF